MRFYFLIPYEVYDTKDNCILNRDLVLEPKFHNRDRREIFESIANSLDIFTINKQKFQIENREFIYNTKGNKSHAIVFRCYPESKRVVNPSKFLRELEEQTGGKIYG